MGAPWAGAQGASEAAHFFAPRFGADDAHDPARLILGERVAQPEPHPDAGSHANLGVIACKGGSAVRVSYPLAKLS